MIYEDEETEVERELLTIWLRSLPSRWHKGQKRRDGIHVSSLISDTWCTREHVLGKLTDERDEQSVSPLVASIFLNGWSFHERWQKLLSNYGTVVEMEQTHYSEKYGLYYTPDAVIEFAGKRYVLEMKGYNTAYFKGLVQEEPPEEAYRQIQLYMHLMNEQRGIILVEDKNNQYVKVWVVEYRGTVVEPYLERLVAVEHALQRRPIVLPSRVCQSSSETRAIHCPLRSVCFKEEE